ncbi:enoyl-CoA hydratase/isomerase family protein [Skermanella mucosa]|uniref:enoyl-CoA hydratase/isomerase family protein n=1 Tax=Skermanella mucosa TaxID=1789672 RepID=UPI00192AC415|nr:enoyl-CoA hydratase-related protein [Skermanella mucosa]UEM20672.1 enoyl-CoA hydratase/isomerase family protein [Skermanella mucosa]
MENLILTEHHGPVVTVTLNRPDKLNAFTKSMWQRLGEVMRRLSDDDSVRCIVLRGAGDRAFSPGNDISEFENERSNSEQASAYGKIIAGTLDAMRTCRHPTVALIKGICVGGGLEIAGSCDIRICGTSSRFGAPINKLGLVMGYAELDALIALAGRSTALEILLEGRIFGAAEAKDKGLVTRVVDDAEVDKEAMATARRISEGAPLVARWHKKFARRLAEGTPLSEAEMDEGYACYDTEDFRIGYRAFLDKVKPEFKGR